MQGSFLPALVLLLLLVALRMVLALAPSSRRAFSASL